MRTLIFSTLIVTNRAPSVTNRSRSRPVWRRTPSEHPALQWPTVGALAELAAILGRPALRDLFRVAAPHAIEVVVVLVAGLAALAWMDSLKHLIPVPR